MPGNEEHTLLEKMLDDEIARDGTTASFMIRAGLLKQILTERAEAATTIERQQAEIGRLSKQEERAKAYYDNLVSMLFGARAEHAAYVKEHGDETLDAAKLRDRMRVLLNTIESVEAGDYYMNCEACGKPLRTGHVVITYDDAGDVHVDCNNPEAESDHRAAHLYEEICTEEWAAAEIDRARKALEDHPNAG